MEINQYKKIVKKHTPKENRLKNGTLAFLIGGVMGMLGEGLNNLYMMLFDVSTKQASTYTSITLIFLGCILTCLGFFDSWVKVAQAGLFVPITGFAHAMQSAALDYRKEGMITGIGANMFKLTGSVIIFGVVSAYIFGMIRYLLGGVL